jgi:hypothetical protein
MSSNCVYGGGSCSISSDAVMTDRTIFLVVFFIFVGIIASIIVCCCFRKSCPLYGDCARRPKDAKNLDDKRRP